VTEPTSSAEAAIKRFEMKGTRLALIQAAVGSASRSTCQTALHFRQWQTVIVLRTVVWTSVDPHTGQAGQGTDMAAQHSRPGIAPLQPRWHTAAA